MQLNPESMQNETVSYDEANVYQTSDDQWLNWNWKALYLVSLVGMKNKHHVRRV